MFDEMTVNPEIDGARVILLSCRFFLEIVHRRPLCKIILGLGPPVMISFCLLFHSGLSATEELSRRPGQVVRVGLKGRPAAGTRESPRSGNPIPNMSSTSAAPTPTLQLHSTPPQLAIRKLGFGFDIRRYPLHPVQSMAVGHKNQIVGVP